jgi:hypothetical protein
MNETELAVKIAARNEVNRLAMEWHRKITQFFAKHMLQRVVKNDGSLLSKVKLEFEETFGPLPCLPKENVYQVKSIYGLTWICKVCKIHKNFCQYEEQVIYIGELKNNVLMQINKSPLILKTDWTVAGVLEAQRRTKAAHAAYMEAQAECGPFIPRVF